METIIKIFVQILCSGIGSFIGCITGIYFACGKETTIDFVKDLLHIDQ